MQLRPSIGHQWLAQEATSPAAVPALIEKSPGTWYLPLMTRRKGEQLGTIIYVGGSGKHTEG